MVVNVWPDVLGRETNEDGNNPFGWYDPLSTIIPNDELRAYLREIIEYAFDDGINLN